MDSPTDMMLCDYITETGVRSMDSERPSCIGQEDGEKDPFLKFIEHSQSILKENAGRLEEDSTQVPSWSWIANRMLKTCVAYSSGVTPAILLSELSLAWNEHNRSGAPKKQSDCIIKLKKKHRRVKLPNNVTIDSVHEKKFLSFDSVIEAVIIKSFTLPGTDIYILTLGDIWSSNTIDLYLHRRFYSIANPKNGILRKGREVLLTGCHLRVSNKSSGSACILPTEYFLVLLDEDEDDDAMLLGAQFCSDSFSSISLGAVEEGTSYSLYARIEHIGPLEIHGENGTLRRKQITLVDSDGMKLNFLLWGEQVMLANLFSVGSMLALDRPFVASAMDSSLETSDVFCLEYGSATHLYVVPHVPHKEKVCVALTQNYQGSRLLMASNLSPGDIVSQVSLPCDSQGSINFSNYPFQSYIVDLRDKMTGISLYGIIMDIRASKGMFSLRIEDNSGAIRLRLYFNKPWSLGRLGVGHTIYVSGLSSSLTPQKSLELSWDENDHGASFFNISCLPAFLNSSCLHKVLSLCDLSSSPKGPKVCHIWLDQIKHFHVETRLMHTLCGHLIDVAEAKSGGGDLECRLCGFCTNDVVERTFHLRITIADDTAKIIAWCIGQTAAELLQISPDEFSELDEEEQFMYHASLEHEKFLVAIAKCRRDDRQQNGNVDWEITRAIKCQ